MMSAAVQPQSAPSSQQYTASTSAPRDRYPVSATPPSARRPVGRSSTDNASLANTPQQLSQASPATMASSRGPSTMTATSPAAYNPVSTDSTPTTAINPASLPIRTSSQQASSQYATTASHDTRSPNTGDTERDGERRRGQRSRPNVPTTSRSATAVGQPPMGSDLPRENSAVITRIVVDDPQADLAREELRKAEARPQPPGDGVTPITGLGLVGEHGVPDSVPAQRSRQEHLRQGTSNRKEVKFGDYILGQTLGEGEFGKVKMGWKKDSTVQVAIKLIRKESLAGNATRLPKIYREIAILRELQHPNIVRLHEFVETERHMGIILEYASGGELFDYILNNRYLKDPAAKRLFAQLVSGVGYLHKKGIVHRDLKLENLLLDRNKHIIITDFGFANTFDPDDELGEAIEARIGDKEFVKREGLDKPVPRRDGREGGHRRGDLMQTSCGSPCYAAPELVVSDGLYTGRKVDVWSCGVILYAMLAGYLPFDDDPANPEGDNINLLYKYIVSTPLTFPEYVTPHARDLLRRILVPDPRRRADLFEVARHSWLSEYTHVVGFIGSRVKSDQDIVATAMQAEEEAQLGRSASVREPANRPAVERASTGGGARHVAAASVGGDEASDVRNQQQRDAKRRTVQLEYVAPNMTTSRGDVRQAAPTTQNVPVSTLAASGRTRAKPEAQGPVEVTPQQTPQKPDVSMPPPSQSTRTQQRPTSDSNAAFGSATVPIASRPNTSGTLTGNSRLPSRGNSYGQPVAAQPTTATARASFSQPKSSSNYVIGGGRLADQSIDSNAQTVGQQQRMGGQYTPTQQPYQTGKPTGHKRSSTLGSIADKVLNRSNSKRQSQQSGYGATNEKKDRKYPPVSMRNNAVQNVGDEPQPPRESMDSRRPSFGFGRKPSKEQDASSHERKGSRRFSLLPSSLSMSHFLGKKSDTGYESGQEDAQRKRDSYQQPPMSQQSQQSQMSQRVRSGSKGMAFGRGASPSPDNTTDSSIPLYNERQRDEPRTQRRIVKPSPQQQQQQQQARYDKALPPPPAMAQNMSALPTQSSTPPPIQRKQYRDDGYGSNRLDPQEPVERFYTPSSELGGPTSFPRTQPDQYNPGGVMGDVQQSNNQGQPQNYDPSDPQSSLRPQQRRFDNAYDHGHSGSSSATRRVMDFFRRRGKDRGEA